ncbi:MAG: methylthioribulose 1-phosphate dehydratase [Cyanobacteriota bacterium]
MFESEIIKIENYFNSIEMEIIDKNAFQNNLKSLINLIHKNYEKGNSPATSTNFSFRIEVKDKNQLVNKNFFIMTRSGIDKEFCNEKDFLIVNEKGEVLFNQEKKHKSSAESPLHLGIYNLFENINFVVHSHSVLSSVLSRIYLKYGKIIFDGYELQKGIKGFETHDIKLSLPIVENTQDMNFLAKKLPEIFISNNPSPYALLLSGHGIYVWGDSYEDAKRHLETYEFLLNALYIESSININK